MQLSEQQKEAVEHIGSPALVVAGAGSGKTRTLTAKIAHLVELGFDTRKILAITFTNKAAGEMKKRLLKQTGLFAGNFPWVRTYHSACLLILKKHCNLLGFATPIQILTSYHQDKIFKEILVGMNVEKKYVAAVKSHISKAKNSANPLAYFEITPRVYRVRLFDVFKKYQKILKEQNAVDFDNILLFARDILREHKDVRDYYRNLFQYILVDEYQDSNDLQEELTRLLLGKHNNLFCVGDDWQAVYGFRGSNVNHFLNFPKNYSNAKIFRLEQNYRSADEIVQVANDLIDYNSNKMDKKCYSEKKGGIVEIHEFYSEYEEAKWVARKIASYHSDGYGLLYDKIAVIYRTKFCSLAFEKIFRTYKTPYQMLGGKGFFERKEIMDLNSYLTAAAFPKDDVAFDRIINVPKRGIGPGMVKKIGNARVGNMSFQDASKKITTQRVLTPKVHIALTDLLAILNDIKNLPPKEALDEVILRTDYMEYIKHYSKTEMEFIAKSENIEQLLFSASESDTITDYLEDASLIREDKEESDDDIKSGVSLMTVHASKGLEYDCVFVVGCEESLFPHWKSMESREDLQEERRLMYVAATRAERFLYLTCADRRTGKYNPRSRFLDEIEEGMM